MTTPDAPATIDFSNLSASELDAVLKQAQQERNARKGATRTHRRLIAQTWREIKQATGDLNDAFYEGKEAFLAAASALYDEYAATLDTVPEGADASIEAGVREYQRGAPERMARGRKTAKTRAENRATREADEAAGDDDATNTEAGIDAHAATSNDTGDEANAGA